MAAPAPIPGIAPAGWSPALIPVDPLVGGSGGGFAGFVQPQISGVSVAIGYGPTDEVPQFQNLDTLGVIVSGYEFTRGRTYELDKNSPGTASLRLIDTTGAVDPSGAGGYFEIGTPVQIALRNPVSGSDTTIYYGYVSKWGPYDIYPTEQYAACTVELVDGLDRLATTEMHPGQGFTLEWGDFATNAIGQDGDIWFYADDQVEHRINQVLDQAQWPNGLRDIFSGNVKVQEAVYAFRTPALSAILDAADAEFPGVANFYISKDGKATFHGRQPRFRPLVSQYGIRIWGAGDMAAVAADSTRALVFGLDGLERDIEKIINSAIATPKGIADTAIENQRVEDAASIAAYGSRSISFDNLLTEQDYFDGAQANAATKKFATYYVSNYADPRTRISRITFKRLPPGDPYAGPVWALLCGVEISDIIRLTTTHAGGGFSAEDFFVEGIHYSVTADDGNEEMTGVTLELDVSPRAYYNVDPWA